jgi:hypothetical protein
MARDCRIYNLIAGVLGVRDTADKLLGSGTSLLLTEVPYRHVGG